MSDETRELQIHLDLEIRVHGATQISEWMLREREDLVFSMLADKLTAQVQNALRETIAKQLGAETATPDDLGEIRNLLEDALAAPPLDAAQYVGRARSILRRITARGNANG